MKKNFQKILDEFMALSEESRDKIFAKETNEYPSTEALSKLFVSLPIEESVRLLTKISSFEIDYFVLRNLLDSEASTVKLFTEIFPRIPPMRLAEILLGNSGHMFGDDKYEIMPNKTLVDLIDAGLDPNQKEKKEFQVLHHIFLHISIGKLVDVVSSIKINSIKTLDAYKFLNCGLEGKKIMYRTIASLEDLKKISFVCKALPIKSVVNILRTIEGSEKLNSLIKLLPQKYKDAAFTAFRGNKSKSVSTNQVKVKNLNLESKRDFFKRNPNSRQINELSMIEKIEIFA